MFTSRWTLCLILVANSVFATQFGDIPLSQTIGSLSITNDTNVTLTLSGTTTDALLKPFTATVGWTGTLAISRGGTGASTAGSALFNLGGEPALGNPLVDGYVLSSTILGARSWIAPASGGAPTDAHYLTDRAETGLSNEVNLGALSTGLLFQTVSAGVATPSIKLIGTDVQAWDTQLDSLASLIYSGNALKVVRVNSGATGFELATVSGGGTIASTTQILKGDGAGNALAGENATPTWTGLHTFNQNPGANLNSDAVLLTNTATASSGNQQYSPSLKFIGQGWSSTNSASRPVDFMVANETVQGTSNPTGTLVFREQVNNGGYTQVFKIGAGTNGTAPSVGVGANNPASLAGSINVSGVLVSSGAVSGKILQADGTSFTSSTPTWPTTASTAGQAIVSDGTNWTNTSTPTFIGLHTNKVSDAVTAAITETFAIGHNSSGTPGAAYGTGLGFYGKSDTTVDRLMGQIATVWKTATDASRTAYFKIQPANQTGLVGDMRFYPSGFLTNVGSGGSDPGSAYIDASAGFRYNFTTPASGKILQSDGSSYVNSTPTWPTTATTAGQAIVSDGTNWTNTSTPTWIGLHTNKVNDSATATITDNFILNHNSTGAVSAGFGSNLVFGLENSAVDDKNAARIRVAWTTATNLSEASSMEFQTMSGGSFLTGLKLYGAAGSASFHGASDPASNGVVGFQSGIQVANAGPSGKILQGDGTKYAASTPTWPTTSGSSGVIVQSNGTNLVTSTPTWPTTGGSSGNIVQSNGTNWTVSSSTWPTTTGGTGYTLRSNGISGFVSYPTQLTNSSTTTQGSCCATNTYVTGSNVTVVAGDWKAKGQYNCRFDVTKTGGTAAPVITVLIGTNASTADTIILTFTLGAGTAVADTAECNLKVTFRSVGSGTSAVVQGTLIVMHNAATGTGFTSTADKSLTPFTLQTSSGFDSSTATQLGVAINGGTSFGGSITNVQATLQQ